MKIKRSKLIHFKPETGSPWFELLKGLLNIKRANFLNFTLKAIDWETTLGSEVKWMAGVGGVRFAPLMSCCFITGSNYSWYRIRIWFNKKIKLYTELFDALLFKGLLAGSTVCYMYLEYIHSLLFVLTFFCVCAFLLFIVNIQYYHI